MSSSRTSTPSNKDAQSYVSRILLPANPLRQMSTNSPYKSSPLRTSSPAPTSSSPWTLSWLTAASPRDRIGTPPSLFNFKSPMRNPIRSPANRSLRVGGPSTPSRLGYLPRVTDLPLEPTSMMERALRILESKKRPLNALSDETENLPLTPDGLATAKRRCASVSTSTVQQNNSHQTALPDVANLGVNGTPEYFKCTSLVDIKRTSRRSSDNHSDLASEPGRPDVVVSTQRNRPVGKPLTSSVLPNRVSCLPSAELEALAFGSRKRPRAESPHTSSTSSAAAELLDSILGTTVASPAAPAAKRVTREIPTQTENASPSVAVSAVTTTAAAATTASTSFSPPTTVQPLRHVSSVSKFIAGLEARARASALARSRSRQMRSFAGQIETLGSPASYSLEARHDRIRKLFASLAEVPSTVTAATTASSLATVSSSSSTVAVTTASLCVTTASAPSVPVFIFGKEQSQKTIESLSSSPATIATASTAEGPVSIFPTAATTTAPAVPFGQKADAIKPELPVVAGLPTASSVVQSEGTTSTAGSAVFSFGNSGMAAAQTTNSTTPLFTVCAGGSLPSSTSTTCSTAATTSTASISSPFVSATGVSLAAPLSSSASVPSFNFGGKSSSSSASTTSSPTFNFGRVEAVATSGSATTTPLTSVFGSAAKPPVTSISAAVSTTFQLASTMTNTSGISASPAPTMTLFMQPKPSTTGLTTTVVPSSVLVASTTSSLFAPSSLPAVVSNSTTNAFSFGLKGTTTSASAVSVPPVSTTGTSQLTTSTLFNFGAKPTAPSTTAPAVPGFSFVTAPSFASEAPVFGSNTSSSSALASNAVPITTTTTASSLFGAINATGAATKPAFSFGALTSASSGTSLSTSQSASSKPSPGFPFTLPSTTAASRATSIFASTAPASSAATSTPTLFAPFAITQNGVSMAATSTTSSVPSTTSSSTFLFGVAPSTSAATNSSSAFGAAGSTVPNFAFSATSTTAPTFKSPAFGSPVGSTTAAATTTSVASTGGFAFTAAVAGPLSVASSLFGNPAVSSFSVGSPSLFGQSPDTSSATLFAPSKASPATSTTSAANRGLSFASVSSASTTSVFGDKFGATTGPVVSSNGFSFGASTATNSTATVAQPALAGGFAFNFKAATANTTSAAPAAVSIFTSPKSSPANLFAAGASTQPSAMAATAPGPFGLMATTTAGPSFTFGSTATSAATTASNMVFGSAGGFGSSVDALKRTASSAFDAAPSTTTTIGPFGSALTFGASATGSPAQPSAAKSVAFGAPVFGVTSAGQPFNFTGGASSTTTPSNGFNFMLGSTTSAQNAFGSPSVGNFVFGQATPPTFGAQPGVGGSPPNPFSANPSPVGTTSLHRRRQLRLKGRR
ncbi:unnamed protein product [Schistocephalus solidus]|uniref:RanBP2-type domain-containing protein n=1 Tax=Schistocephalus solidus TaxID=70667 RepID=A0A183T6Q6_SCHSO|nr:unnamed protein product [Schistocephalus solidus]